MGSVYEIELTHGQQAVLLAMADHAQDDGTDVFPALARLAWKTGYDKRQIRRLIRELQAIGVLVEVAPPAQHRPTEYRIDLDAGEQKEPYVPDAPPGPREDISAPRGGKNDIPGRTPRPPKPSVEPSNKPSGRSSRKRVKVNRKAVTEDEFSLAAAVVQLFNDSAGTALSVEAHLTPIVGRIREKPKYTEEHHRKIIEAVFAGEHWWTGPPTPKIIYGNPSIFEQSIELARERQKKAETKLDVNAQAKRIRQEQGLE